MVGFAHSPEISCRAPAQTIPPPQVSPGTRGRQRAILRLLAQTGRISVGEIAERFEISPATARRDVVALAVARNATRTHGGLQTSKSFSGEQHFCARCAIQSSAKAHIARKAVQLLPHNGCVFIDAGTTCLEVGRLLLSRPRLCIFTNSVPLLELANEADATIVSVGGEARRVSSALTGAFNEPWGPDFHFDAAVVGATGLDVLTGPYTSEIHEAAVKAEALRRADIRMLVADAEKWQRPMAVSFAPWAAFSLLVTNQEVSRETRLALSSHNVTVHLAI